LIGKIELAGHHNVEANSCRSLCFPSEVVLENLKS
jgi:hypothetical protein